jgi:hypothetical protein
VRMFIADGQLYLVAKADCPDCNGIGWVITWRAPERRFLRGGFGLCSCVKLFSVDSASTARSDAAA